jgi:hypothetical protein
MPTRAEEAQIAAAKQVMNEVEGFIRHGREISPFVEALLSNDFEEAERKADRVVKKYNMIPELREWIEANVPPGLFLYGREDLQKWMEQRGMEGASSSQEVLLGMFANRWRRSERGPVHQA